MSVSVCPTDIVHAPAERVWALLSDPTKFDLWWDAHTDRITPPGPAEPGQTVEAHARALGHDWPIHFTVNGVDAARHALDLTTDLPFGIHMHNHLTVLPIDAGASRLTFG